MVLYLQVLLWRQLRAVELVESGGVLVVNKSRCGVHVHTASLVHRSSTSARTGLHMCTGGAQVISRRHDS